MYGQFIKSGIFILIFYKLMTCADLGRLYIREGLD
jgi:hypothetical protein